MCIQSKQGHANHEICRLYFQTGAIVAKLTIKKRHLICKYSEENSAVKDGNQLLSELKWRFLSHQ
jgi:hypothetical protein